jgi:hypothetical protein
MSEFDLLWKSMPMISDTYYSTMMKIPASLTILLLGLCLLPIIVVADDDDDDVDCPCRLTSRPNKSEKALTARWMVHSLDWGVLSTISTRSATAGIPFGNIYSFVDGTCQNSTGVPYFYGTYLDQSLLDSKENNRVSLSLSEASLSSVCPKSKKGLEACTLGTKYGDPEIPVCARLTLTGELVVVDEEKNDSISDEYQFAQKALFQRHPTMKEWPEDHNWVLFKLDIQDVWLIDYFGGAAILTPEDYFAANLLLDDEMDEV